MIRIVTSTPGGGRSPSTETPPPPPPPTPDPPKSSREVRVSPRARSAALSIVRWGLLMGGLVIIADLATLAMIQRTVSPDDQAAIAEADELINWVLFSILGILAVRESRLWYAGIIAGVIAAIVDTIVVSAAQLMAPIAGLQVSVQEVLVRNLIIGLAFAGVSGVVYALVQRSSGGQRPR